jgi:hypothetical protein
MMTGTGLAGGRSSGLWRLALWGGLAAVLCAPLVAMQFTSEVNWTWFDFAMMGGLLGVGGVAFEVAMWTCRTTRARWIAGLVILGVVVGVWGLMASGPG